MVRGGAGGAQDAAFAPGIREASPHLLGETLEVGVVRAGGCEQNAALGNQWRRQANHLAVALEALGQVLLRLHESRWIDDHQPVALAGVGLALQLLENLSLHEAAAAGDIVGLGRPGGELEGALRSEEHTSELQSLMRISY